MNLEQQLRKEIMEQLREVNPRNAPSIYKRIQSETGYHCVEKSIINMVIQDGITPSAAIAQIEMESI